MEFISRFFEHLDGLSARELALKAIYLTAAVSAVLIVAASIMMRGILAVVREQQQALAAIAARSPRQAHTPRCGEERLLYRLRLGWVVYVDVQGARVAGLQADS